MWYFSFCVSLCLCFLFTSPAQKFGEPPSRKAKWKDIELKIEPFFVLLTLFCENLKRTQYQQNNIKALLEEAAGLGWDLSATSSKIPLNIPSQVSDFQYPLYDYSKLSICLLQKDNSHLAYFSMQESLTVCLTQS